MAYFTDLSSLKTINIGTLNVEGRQVFSPFLFTALRIYRCFSEDSHVNCTIGKGYMGGGFFGFAGFFGSFFKDFIYLFLDRGEGQEKERERNINVAFCMSPTQDLARDSCMCPD